MESTEKKDTPGMLAVVSGSLDEPEELRQKINSLISPTVVYTYETGKKRLCFVGKSVTDILGYNCEEVRTWDDYLSVVVYKDDKDAAKKEIRRIYSLKEDETHTYYCRLNNKHGISKHFRTSARVLRWRNDGFPDSFLFVAQDITGDIIRQKEQQLELEKQVAELERSNEELEEFAYIASHDLQEPLRKITTFSQRINADETISSENRAALARVLKAAENMKALIYDLLEFSRVRQSILGFENTDLNILLNEVKAELDIDIAETGTVIHSDKLPWLDVMPGQIKQLFSNVILNAIKFRKPGQGADITISCSPVTWDEGYDLQQGRDYCKISFVDNGIGFEPEYAEKIFKIFQRLHGKAEYPGTGVGLAICRRITDNHNGYMFATGSPGEGSTFVIILPEKNKN